MVVALAMGIQASTITSFAGSAISTVVVTSIACPHRRFAADWMWPGAGVKPPSATNTLLMTPTWSGYPRVQ